MYEGTTRIRRPCGAAVVVVSPMMVRLVPNERDQSASERERPAHRIQPDFLARELVAERCAPLRERCLGSFFLTPRVFDELQILLGPLIARSADDEVCEPLTRRGERRPEWRDIARRVGPQPLARGHFVEHERAAAHERVEDAGDGLRCRSRRVTSRGRDPSDESPRRSETDVREDCGASSEVIRGRSCPPPSRRRSQLRDIREWPMRLQV